jgi:predicted transposase YbfD/YdcC
VQSTPLVAAVATACPSPTDGAPTSLAAAFAAVPDPRRAASVRYPLAAVLALAVAAVLANHRSVLAIAEWGARQTPALLQTLGFPTARTPCQSTLHRLFRHLNGDALAAVLAAYVAPTVVPGADRQGVAIDGKAQRGRLRFGATGCPVHALSAFGHASGLVLAHEPITADGDKAAAELAAAPALVARLAWPDRVLTGDALFCQRGLCRQVCAAGGAGALWALLLVKENQPALHAAIALLFDPPADLAALPLLDRREARTLDHGHGRRDECRHLIASTDLSTYLDWPGVAQVFRRERTWIAHGTRHRALRYGITSLAPDQADAARLLALRRGHWAIENALHRQKDVAFGEDASLIHLGQGPTVMALVRDAALTVLHQAGIRRIATRLRLFAQHPELAIALVVNPPPTHA